MSIRAIGITPNYVNKNNNRSAVSFGKTVSDEVVEHTREEMKGIKSMARTDGATIGFFSGVGLSVLTSTLYSAFQNDEAKETLKRFEKISLSPEMKKDTFMVKDITGDEKPDIILFKKDGTKVVFDAAKCKILEEETKTNLKEVK